MTHRDPSIGERFREPGRLWPATASLVLASGPRPAVSQNHPSTEYDGYDISYEEIYHSFSQVVSDGKIMGDILGYLNHN